MRKIRIVLKSSMALIVMCFVAMLAECSSGGSGGSQATTWGYSFTVDGAYQKDSSSATIVLEGAPDVVQRVFSQDTEENRQLSTLPFHVTKHIELGDGYPSLVLQTGTWNTCSVSIRAMRFVWNPAAGINTKDSIEVDTSASELANCQLSVEAAEAAVSKSDGGSYSVSVSGVSDDADDLPVITPTQLIDDFKYIGFSTENSGTQLSLVINNWTIWDDLNSVDQSYAAHPRSIFSNPNDTLSMSHGGWDGWDDGIAFPGNGFYYLDCYWSGACSSVTEPASQAMPMVTYLFESEARGDDTRIQIDSMTMHDQNGVLAAELKFNWDAWDTSSGCNSGSVHGETFCDISEAINNNYGWFSCTGYNGYNCDLSAYSDSYAGQNNLTELVGLYEIAYQAMAAALTGNPAGLVVTIITQILTAIYDYFDVHAYGTLILTLTHDVPCELPGGYNCGWPFGLDYDRCAFLCGGNEGCNYAAPGGDVRTSAYIGNCETCPDPSTCACDGSHTVCGEPCTGCPSGQECGKLATIAGVETGCVPHCADAPGGWTTCCDPSTCYYDDSFRLCAQCGSSGVSCAGPCLYYDAVTMTWPDTRTFLACDGQYPPAAICGGGYGSTSP